ncbi:MAG: hypothetical protein Kow00120_00300 [Anaerolineae bacterium]
MSNAAQLIAAGFAKARLHRLDTAGYAAGINGVLANGEDAGSYEIQGPRTADMSVPDPETTDIVGGNTLMGAFTWPLGQTPRGSFEGAVFDMDLNVALEGIKKRTLGGVELQVVGAKEADPKDVCLWFMSDAVSKTTGYKGLKRKFGLLAPKASARFLGAGQVTQRQELTARLALTIQGSDVYPWGEAISLANEGATEGLMILFAADYWVDLHAFVGDGTTDTVVLQYTPAGDHTATPARCTVYEDGTALTPTTDWQLNPATKTLTFQAGSIPAAGAKVAIWYEHL